MAFCDFSSLPNPTYTYRLEIDWYGARYVVGPDYGGSGGSQPQTSFVKFDPSNLQLTVSGLDYSTDRYHSGPINFHLCVNELSDHCSSAFVLNYSDGCQANSLSWTDDKHITDENGDVNVDAANNNALSYTLPLQDTGLGVWIPKFTNSNWRCKLEWTATFSPNIGSDTSYYAITNDYGQYSIKLIGSITLDFAARKLLSASKAWEFARDMTITIDVR